MLSEDVYLELDRRLDDTDTMLQRAYPGEADGRQPVHTVYVPADRFRADVIGDWSDQAMGALNAHASRSKTSASTSRTDTAYATTGERTLMPGPPARPCASGRCRRS